MTIQFSTADAQTFIDREHDFDFCHMPITDALLEDIRVALHNPVAVSRDPWTDIERDPSDQVLWNAYLAERYEQEEAEEVLQAAVKAWKAQADAIRESCQMISGATYQDVTITPNTEFVNQSCAVDIRRQALRGWPINPRWYVTLSVPAAVGVEAAVQKYDSLDSWEEVLAEAVSMQAAYSKEKEACSRRHREEVAQVQLQINALRKQLHEAEQKLADLMK